MRHQHDTGQKTLDESVLIPFVLQDKVAGKEAFELGEVLVALISLLITDTNQHHLQLVELADRLHWLDLGVLRLGFLSLRLGCRGLNRVFHNILEFNCRSSNERKQLRSNVRR